MSTNLELFFSEKSRFPIPDDAVDLIYSGWVAWSQWEFWKNVTRLIKNFWQDIPSDPLYENFYSYSITNNGKEYQIWSIVESLDEESELFELAFNFQSQSKVKTALVQGNYNEIMVRVKTLLWDHVYIASPSIISNDLSVTWALDTIIGQNLVYNEFFNLPASYSWFLDTDKWFNFNVSDPIIFSGSTSDLKSNDWIKQFIDKTRYIYAITPTESFDKYISFLQDNWTSKMKNFLTKRFNISYNYAFSCQDLYDDGKALESNFYDIDVDGSGPIPSELIFCDITSDGRGLTRIWANHLWANGWNFTGGNHISTNFYSLYPSSPNNTIIPLINPGESWNVIRQTGDYTSNYEVHFDDFSVVNVGDEIRMTLWVSWNTDGWWTNNLNFNSESWYMFHNRIYYTDGTFSSNGETEILQTQNIWWLDWYEIRTKHIVRKSPQDFSWYIGLDAEDVKDLYFTWVKLELFRN